MYSTAKSFLPQVGRAVLGGHGSLTVRALIRLQKNPEKRRHEGVVLLDRRKKTRMSVCFTRYTHKQTELQFYDRL